MVEDFNLMFDNAQQYNRPDSRIYRDAVKLQKYIQNKAEEIMAMDDEVSRESSVCVRSKLGMFILQHFSFYNVNFICCQVGMLIYHVH